MLAPSRRLDGDGGGAAITSACLRKHGSRPKWVLSSLQLLGGAAGTCLGPLLQAFWSANGMSRAEIGLLTLGCALSTLAGQLCLWSVAAARQDCKGTMIAMGFLGTLVSMLNLLPAIQRSFGGLTTILIII